MDKARERFVRLAEARTTKLLKGIDVLGNLANRNNYSYTEPDIRKIFRSLRGRLKQVEGMFLNEQAKEKGQGFKLEE